MNFYRHELIAGWRDCPIDSPPYLFPRDGNHLEFTNERALSLHKTFEDYIVSSKFGSSSDRSLHVGLIPIPYIGNLERASIFILMLNPGLSAGDYYAEQNVSEFKLTLIRNLRQENSEDEFPFFGLDPKFAWHPGFRYWNDKLHKIAKGLASSREVSYQSALKVLAQNIACLEYIAYHSKSFGIPSSLSSVLPSTKAMIAFVHDMLVPKVKTDETVIIVTRSAKNWKLPTHENIIVYSGSEARAAHLTMKSRGGKVIAERLGL